MTKDDIPEAGETVDVFLPVGILEHRAVAADPHAAGPVHSGIVQRVDERGEIAGEQVLQSGVIVSAGTCEVSQLVGIRTT